jgi:hypothetical protein
VWRTGGRAERIGYLTGLRRRDGSGAATCSRQAGGRSGGPCAAARRWAVLADEEFLEHALDDPRARSGQRWLLTQLPSSDFSAGPQRAAGLLQVEGHGPGQRLATRLPVPGHPTGTGSPPRRRARGRARRQLTRLIAAARSGAGKPDSAWRRAPRDPCRSGTTCAPMCTRAGGWRLWQASSVWAEALLAVGRRTAPRAPVRLAATTSWPTRVINARVTRATRCWPGPARRPDAVAAAAACAPPWPDELARAVIGALRAAIAAPHRSHSPPRWPPPRPAAWTRARGPPRVAGQPGQAGRRTEARRGRPGELARQARLQPLSARLVGPAAPGRQDPRLRRMFLAEIR